MPLKFLGIYMEKYLKVVLKGFRYDLLQESLDLIIERNSVITTGEEGTSWQICIRISVRNYEGIFLRVSEKSC